MGFLDHLGESEFPMSKDKVFDALCKGVPTIQGMKVESADRLQSRIMVKTGVSLFSWGEVIPVQLTEIDANKTKVQINSSPKTGALGGGAFDMGKNRKNIEAILAATSKNLSNPSQSQNWKCTKCGQKFSGLPAACGNCGHPMKYPATAYENIKYTCNSCKKFFFGRKSECPHCNAAMKW